MVPNLALYLVLISEVFAPPRRLADLKYTVRPVAMIQNDANPNASDREVVGVEQLWAELEAEQESRGESCVQSYQYRERVAAARLRLARYRAEFEEIGAPAKRVPVRLQMEMMSIQDELQKILNTRR